MNVVESILNGFNQKRNRRERRLRLINADKINFNEVFVGASEFAQDTRNVAQMLINRQPTAYDVDKVVEQLKTDSLIKLYGSGNSDNYLISLEKAIEIVKAGGNS